MKIKNLYKDDISVSKGAFKIPISGLIDKYRARFEVLDKSGRFSHRVFRVLPNRTLVHVLVPSETLDDFSYDVVIEFNSMASDLMNSVLCLYMLLCLLQPWPREGSTETDSSAPQGKT